MRTETLTPAAQLTGWLRFPDQAKLDAACVLMRERLHLMERQPNHLVITFADALDTAATDLPLLSYQPLKHPLTLLAKGAVAGWLDVQFALGTPGAPRDQRFYAGGHQAYRYEQAEEVDHLLPATYQDTVVLRTWSMTDGAQLATHVHPWRGARGACTDLALHGTRLVSVTDDAARVFHLGMVTS